MSDGKNIYSTYAVKLEGEVKEELQTLLEGYKGETGATAGDFIKTMLEVYKTNKIVSKVSSTDSDIKELNTLTSRIYSIYSNLIERNNNNNNALQQEFGGQLSKKDNEINNLKTKLQEVEQENVLLKDDFNNSCEDKIKLEQELQQVRELNDSHKLNISKLQEDTKSLHELKEINNKLLNEIETTKGLLADSKSKNFELTNSIKDKENNISKLNDDIERIKNYNIKFSEELKNKYNEDIEKLKEKYMFENEKCVLEMKQEHQKKLEDLNNKHYKEIQEYQEKHKELLNQLEKKNNSHRKNKKTEENINIQGSLLDK